MAPGSGNSIRRSAPRSTPATGESSSPTAATTASSGSPLPGSPLGQLGGAGSGEGQFRKPEGFTIGPNREVVVADTGNNRIQVLDQAGRFIRAFGSPGSGPASSTGPSLSPSITMTSSIVVDQGNNRIQRFTADGQFVAAFGSAGSSSRAVQWADWYCV